MPPQVVTPPPEYSEKEKQKPLISKRTQIADSGRMIWEQCDYRREKILIVARSVKGNTIHRQISVGRLCDSCRISPSHKRRSWPAFPSSIFPGTKVVRKWTWCRAIWFSPATIMFLPPPMSQATAPEFLLDGIFVNTRGTVTQSCASEEALTLNPFDEDD